MDFRIARSSRIKAMRSIGTNQLARLLSGEIRGDVSGQIRSVCTDSRRAEPGSVFFALAGERTDGHGFVHHAWENGAVAAVVARDSAASIEAREGRALIYVSSPLAALQQLARWYRRESITEVLAVTGSNGKTIVKDALVGLLIDRSIAASPGSFNSQLGVPLSILAAPPGVELGIFEAGLSQPGEMEKHRAMLDPNYGLLTNIGLAHVASMGGREALAREKMGLFESIPEWGWVVLPAHEPLIDPHTEALTCTAYRLGDAEHLPVFADRVMVPEGQVLGVHLPGGETRQVQIHTRSPEIVEDLLLAASAAHLLGVSLDQIAAGLDGYFPQATRMEIRRTADEVTIVNDACSSDPTAVESALRSTVASAAGRGRRIFVFGGMRELGERSAAEHAHVGELAAESEFGELCLVGEGELEAVADGYRKARPEGEVVYLPDASALGRHLSDTLHWGDTVLFKGPRGSGLAQAARDISGSLAQRSLRVDLGAVAENVLRFQRHCGAGVQVLAMAKALAYGTQLVRLAYWMSRTGVQHIGVSSVAEGIQIRKTGLPQKVYVFLADRDDVASLVRYRLVPVIYSADFARHLVQSLEESGGRLEAHLKVDTGMHRLGVEPSEAVAVARELRSSSAVDLTGVCTHFAAAEDPIKDDLTRDQIRVFDEVLAGLQQAGFEDLVAHAANSAAAARFPEAHYDMVRPGLGLYGIYPSPAVAEALQLQLAVSLTSRITEVRTYDAGQRLGYHGAFETDRRMRVGTVAFGYADGTPDNSLRNRTFVLVEGARAPVLGAISMDQMQVDLTDIPDADVGSEVLLYGARSGHTLRPEVVAEAAGLIPHRLLVMLGNRVERVYVEP
jgi:alanine racemase/UDP-N-acetylmuramoyl-tripeptide--D-alanyl-D-alanine ligase